MHGTKLKQYVIKNNLVPHDKCAICSNTWEWMGKKLVLQLDHIDGNHYNDDTNNLRFLCPNCHSQQETSNRRKPSMRLGLESVLSVLPDCYSKREVLTKLGKSESGANFVALTKLFKDNNLQIMKKRPYVYHPIVATRRVQWPKKEELAELLQTTSMVKIGEKYGVSGVAVRKWAKRYSLI